MGADPESAPQVALAPTDKKMKAEVITIGSELLLGGCPDTNSVFLIDQLARLGIEVKWKTVVGDDEQDMEEIFRRALQRSTLVITTGGLGSTLDDLTKKVVAKATRRRLVLKEDLLQDLRDKFQKRKALSGSITGPMPKEYERQALLPSRAQVFKNPVGTAPGFALECGACHLVVLPGVPHEMRRIFSDSVKGFLQRMAKGKRPLSLHRIRTFGLAEVQVNDVVRDLSGQLEDLKLGLLAGPTGVDIYVTTCRKPIARDIEDLREVVRKRLGEAVYAEEGQEMEEVVGLALKRHRLRLSVAESCTGGLIGHRLTNVPGSSTYFERGVVCYSDLCKVDLIGVPQGLIAGYGAVSSQVACAMAEGIRRLAKTDLGLGITGIAGPGGGTATKPVGRVHVALAYEGGTLHERFHFVGDREALKLSFSQAGLDLVRRHLLSL
jgi:nicotinamide-nucleotide amidase